MRGVYLGAGGVVLCDCAEHELLDVHGNAARGTPHDLSSCCAYRRPASRLQRLCKG